jgi:hypothetical protein
MAEQIEYIGNGVWLKPDGSLYEEVAHLLMGGSGIAYHINKEGV